MTNDAAKPAPSDGSTARVEKVREAVEKMVSSKEPVLEHAQQPEDPAELAAQNRLAEIERHVGELVGADAIEEDGRARES